MRKLILNIFAVNVVVAVAALALASPSNAQYVITEIIDSTGDGTNFYLGGEYTDTAVDAAGNVYVTSESSNNAFKITPSGVITQIIDSTGDGTNLLEGPYGVAVDASGNVYISAGNSDNAFKIQPVPSPVPALANQGLVILGASLFCVVLWVARRQRSASG